MYLLIALYRMFDFSSIKEEQEDEEISENYPYESPESTDEHGHSPEMLQEEISGSPERAELHFDRVPSLWRLGSGFSTAMPTHSQHVWLGIPKSSSFIYVTKHSVFWSFVFFFFIIFEH